VVSFIVMDRYHLTFTHYGFEKKSYQLFQIIWSELTHWNVVSMWPTFVSRCRKKVRRREMPRKRRQESLSSRRGGAALEHSETTTMFVNLPCTTPIRQNTQQLSADKIYVIRLKRYKHTEFYFVSNNCALLFWHET
jgi:hypothetical protein